MNFHALYTWLLAHPTETLGALSATLYLGLNLWNSRVPVEKRNASVLYRALDRLAFLTAQGAKNNASWPVFGRSVADDAKSQIVAQIVPEKDVPPVVVGDEKLHE